MSAASYDKASGIITLQSADGLNSPDDIRRRQQEVIEVIARAKAEHGFARLLHVASNLPVQSQETTSASSKAAEQNVLDGPKDRFAIVMDSTLARMQFSRIAGADNRRAFATEAEARAWLTAD